MASTSQLVDYLVMECEEADSTAFVDELHALAKAEILEGNGSIGFVTTAAANGKNFTLNQSLTCLEVAAACLQAKRLHLGTASASPITFIDFSRA